MLLSTAPRRPLVSATMSERASGFARSRFEASHPPTTDRTRSCKRSSRHPKTASRRCCRACWRTRRHDDGRAVSPGGPACDGKAGNVAGFFAAAAGRQAAGAVPPGAGLPGLRPGVPAHPAQGRRRAGAVRLATDVDRAREDEIRARLAGLVEPEAAAEDGEDAQIDGAIAEAM